MTASDFTESARKELGGNAVQLPAVVARNEKRVERGFWRKLARVGTFIPFSEDLVAAYYCARDPKTPTRVRAVLIAALAYFVVPADAIPDFIAVLGFSDDATVLATAIGIVSTHIKVRHRNAAQKAIADLKTDGGA